jgi:hypothetical protein
MPATTKDEAGYEAQWLLAQYFEEYERIGGAWYFASLQADIKFVAPHLAGWAALANGPTP